MLNYTKKKLTLFWISLIPLTIAAPTLSNPLFVKTIVTIDSNLVENQLLREGQSGLIFKHGFYRGLLHPIYKSVRIESTSCTNMKLNVLRQVGNGIALNVSAGSILGCPYSPFVRIISTTKSKDTRVSFNTRGREVLLGSINTINSYNNSKGELIIGSSNGSSEVKYLNYKASIATNLFIKSPDNKNLSSTYVSPKPYLNSVARLANNLHRVCTDKDNIIISKLDYQSQLLGNSNCLDTVTSDKFLVQSPMGYSYYKFQS